MFFNPVNITHLGDTIMVPEERVYEHCKALYEEGLGHRYIPTQRENELLEFFEWKVKYRSSNFKWLIDLLMR
jgi:hypothetical protein